ncbi:MAG: hypothetical protein KGM24_14245 [Elusimicrobia bacterium]|nr:hypothetical protein [Elusimicrobiota bacterium]
MRTEPRLRLEWPAAFLLCAAPAALLLSRAPGLPGVDGYFHIRFAQELRERGLPRNGFPWLAFGLWKRDFSDTSPLFHLLLIPFTFGSLVLGAKAATVLLSAFATSSLLAILALDRVRARWYWFAVLLLGGWGYWWRMLLPRPELLSVAFLLWSLWALANGRRKAFACLSLAYPLAYAAPFLPQLAAAARWARLRLFERRAEGGLLGWGLAACAAGFVVHPYFPKDLRLFWVQVFRVMEQALTRSAVLPPASELTPLPPGPLLAAHLLVVVHLAALVWFLRRRPARLSERTRTLIPAFLIVAVLAVLARRFMEYAVPVGTLLCAYAYDDLLAGRSWRDLARALGARPEKAAAVWLALLAAGAAFQFGNLALMLEKVPPPRLAALSRAVAAKAPDGATVFACRWDETPELFFHDDRRRYLAMMDPTFLYDTDPGVWTAWQAAVSGRLSPKALRAVFRGVFHSRFGICDSKDVVFRAAIARDPAFRILRQDAGGYAFELR